MTQLAPLFLACLALLVGPPPEAAVSAPDAEEYAVYSALISEVYVDEGVELIVIENRTRARLQGAERLNPDAATGAPTETRPLRRLGQETFDDFLERNKQPRSLQRRFDFKVKHVLVSNEEMEAVFAKEFVLDRTAWDRFYAAYPRSQGRLQLSSVGFDKTKNQALVYVGNQKHFLSGAGYYVLLEKQNEVWVVLEKVTVWIS